MNRASLIGLSRTAIVGVALSLVALVITSNTPVHASSAPDLWLDGLTIGMDLETPRVGGTIQMQASIRNVGDQSSAATTVRFYRSSDATITTADTEVASTELSSVAADTGTNSAWVDITAPSTEGTYYYGACVDVVTDETVTTNNCRAWRYGIPVPLPRPDLVVQTPSVDDATLETGATLTLSATVAHAGSSTWPSPSTTLRYYRSTDATITTADTEVGTDEVDGLFHSEWSSGSSDESIDLTAPSTVGTYYYGACVDSVMGESDTTNNCSSSVTVTVQNSVATGAPTISGTAQVGQTLTASPTGISDADGLDNVTYSYQWLADDADIDGATSSTYTVQSSDNGKVIKVRVTFTDNGDSDESLTSAGTSAVVLGGL